MKVFKSMFMLLCVLSVVFSCSVFSGDTVPGLNHNTDSLIGGIYYSDLGYVYEVCSEDSTGECTKCKYAKLITISGGRHTVIRMNMVMSETHYDYVIVNPCVYRQVRIEQPKENEKFSSAPLNLQRVIL